MPTKVTLLKPFVFSHSAKENERLTKEIKFFPNKDKNGKWVPTEIEIPDEVAEHEWIANNYADGAIERPEVTAARAEAEKKRLEKVQEDNAIQLAKAEQAMSRSGAGKKAIDLTDAAVQKELNTPVSELKGARGKSIDKPVNKASA